MTLPAEYTRFPSHWEVLPFTKAIKDATSGNAKIQKAVYSETGSIPIVDQGQSLYGGYTDDSSAVCKSDLPTIVFGDHTRAFKYIETPFALGADGAKILEPTANLDKRFVYHYLKQLRIESAGYSRHFKFLKEAYVPVPPLTEQKRIAAILDKADAIRRKRQQAIQLADEFLRAVFLDMFGDPVTNPKGWEVRSLNDVCTKVTDGTHDTPSRLESGKPYITGKHIRPFSIDYDNCDYVSEEVHREIFKRCNPEKGDVLYTNIGVNLGTAALNIVDYEFSMKNVALLKPDHSLVYGDYIAHALNNNLMKSEITRVASLGGAQGFLSLKDIRALDLPIPPKSLQERFKVVIDKSNQNINKCSKSIDKSIELISSLSQKAFSGGL